MITFSNAVRKFSEGAGQGADFWMKQPEMCGIFSLKGLEAKDKNTFALFFLSLCMKDHGKVGILGFKGT